MANPRKFSEKIALHKQRQAEEQASYERVLMEVRAVTQTPVQQNPMPTSPRIPPHLSHHLAPSHLLDRTVNRGSMRNASIWSSMPNINAYAHGPNSQPSHSHQGGPAANSMASSFQSQMAQSVANFHSSGHHNVPNGESNMFYDHHNMNSSQNNINQMAQPSQYLEAPGWPTMNGHAQPPPNYAQHQNLGGNLSRCYSDNNLYQSTPNIKLKSANIEPVNHDPVNPLVNNSHPPSALTSMRNRRLRPPEQTPQGAPCGSLPDLNKLVIPKTNRPSSAKTQTTPKTPDVFEGNRRGPESPRVAGPMRDRAPSNPPTSCGSPRPNPRRQHPYRIDTAGNRLSWNLGGGSSPSSPVSPSIQQSRLNSNSLPASPQTPRTQEIENGFLKETLNDCLNSPSPVPEIVLTPSGTDDYSMNEHPLQLSTYPSNQSYFGSQIGPNSGSNSSGPIGSPVSANQSDSGHGMDFSGRMDFSPGPPGGQPGPNQSPMNNSDNPSMPSNFTFMSEINSIAPVNQPVNQHQTQSHDIPALITPNQQQLELLENGKPLFDNL